MASFTELALAKLDTAFSKVNRNHRLTLARQKLMRRWPKRWLRILYKDLNIVMESNNKIIKDGNPEFIDSDLAQSIVSDTVKAGKY